MKLVLLVFLLMGFLNAQDTKQKVTLGLGPYFQTQPYKDTSTIVVPSPVIFFDNSLFYIRWSRAGVYFLGDKQEDFAWGLSLTVQPRPNGYSASDSPYLVGMDTRERTIEGGVAFSAKYKETYLEVMLLTDLLDRYNSWIVRTELGDKYELGDFTFYPSLVLLYQSNQFVNYYYGVKSNEVDTSIGRNFYQPKGGFQVGAQTYINYSITDNWSTLLNIRADKLTSEQVNSPLVADKYIYSGLVSLIYTFEY